MAAGLVGDDAAEAAVEDIAEDIPEAAPGLRVPVWFSLPSLATAEQSRRV